MSEWIFSLSMNNLVIQSGDLQFSSDTIIRVCHWELARTFVWTSHFTWVWFITKLLFLLFAVQNDGAAATPWTRVQGRTRQIIVLSWRLINDVLVLITLVTFCELQIFPLLFLWLGSDWRCARRCQKPSAEALFHPFSTRPDFSSHVFLPLKGKSKILDMWWTSHIKYRHVNGPQRGKKTKTKQKNHREFQTVLETEASEKFCVIQHGDTEAVKHRQGENLLFISHWTRFKKPE